MLERNLITDLYIWVHPGNGPINSRLLAEWERTIKILANKPTSALVETSNARGNVRYSETIDQFEGLEDWKYDLIRVGRLEEMAANLLGERYMLWPHGNFIDANDSSNINFLLGRLNLTPRIWSGYGYEKHLYQIICFGLKPFACVTWQADDYGLRKLAYEVTPYGESALESLESE